MDEKYLLTSSSYITEKFAEKKRSASKKPRRNLTLSDELENVFTLEEIKQEVQCWNQFKNFIRGQTTWPGKTSDFNKISGLCLATPKEQKLLVKFRNTGLSRLTNFLRNSTKKEANSKDVKLLTWCCLSLLSFYFSKRQDEGCTCFKVRKLDESKTLFRTALYLILPEKQEAVVKYTIKYITLTSQWNTNDYDFFVLQELYAVITKPEILLAKIIKQIETSQKVEALKEAFNISCTLSSILEHAHWEKYLFNHLLHNCLNTLLKLYLVCSFPVSSAIKLDNIKLRMVTKTCIKYFVNNIRDNKGLVSVLDTMAKCLQDLTIVDEDRVEIMEMIAFCAQKHQTKFYRESITPDLLELLLKNLFSSVKTIAMTSHKIIHHLLDRHSNEKHFTEPVYFFKGRGNFTINTEYSIEDIHFFKSFSNVFLDGIHHCFLKFTDKHCLTNCYITLSLVLVEVPDPVITINIIHILITIQYDVLKNQEMTLTVKAQIHAIISALISLVCVVHKNEVVPLRSYVEEVVRFRTENSPHLLPPLQNKYILASHHTADYHDQLYFLEQEVLYALQRCWLAKRATGFK